LENCSIIISIGFIYFRAKACNNQNKTLKRQLLRLHQVSIGLYLLDKGIAAEQNRNSKKFACKKAAERYTDERIATQR